VNTLAFVVNLLLKTVEEDKGQWLIWVVALYWRKKMMEVWDEGKHFGVSIAMDLNGGSML
jgi:hypothetical protein